MARMFNWLNISAGMAGGIISFAFGGFDNLFGILLMLIILDFAVGIAKGIHNRRLSSNLCMKGICKKAIQLAVIAMANMIGTATGDALPFREVVIMFFIANEAISIMENAADAGVEIPDSLKKVLHQIKNKEDNKEEK